MVGFLREGGYPMYVIAAVTVLVIASFVRSLTAWRAGSATFGRRVDAILFWGGLALIVGVIGTLVGISQMAQAVERIGSVSPSILWGGLRVALSTMVAGFLVFGVSFIAWAGLRPKASAQPT